MKIQFNTDKTVHGDEKSSRFLLQKISDEPLDTNLIFPE